VIHHFLKQHLQRPAIAKFFSGARSAKSRSLPGRLAPSLIALLLAARGR
jgi:hypothetical protein